MCTHIIRILHLSDTLIQTRTHAANHVVWVRLIGGFHKEENLHYAGLKHSGWLSPTIAHCQNWQNIYILPERRLFLYKPLNLRTFLLLFAPYRASLLCSQADLLQTTGETFASEVLNLSCIALPLNHSDPN